MKRLNTIPGQLNIEQFAALLAREALPTCSVRTARKWLKKYRGAIRAGKLGGIMFASEPRCVALAAKIRTGKATL